MLGLFKRREWQLEILPELKGSCGGINVVVSRMVCRIDKSSEKRTYAYSDFGFEFLNELHNQLGEFRDLQKMIVLSNIKKVSLKLRDLPAIYVEIGGSIPDSKEQFYSDIADALIDAFKSQGIN